MCDVQLSGARQAGAKRDNNKQQTYKSRTSRPSHGEEVAPTVKHRTIPEMWQLKRLNYAKSALRMPETLSR
jgi:hypothetical protein